MYFQGLIGLLLKKRACLKKSFIFNILSLPLTAADTLDISAAVRGSDKSIMYKYKASAKRLISICLNTLWIKYSIQNSVDIAVYSSLNRACS